MTRNRARASKRPLRIGILGFKCDPPHLFHLLLAERARCEHNLDSILFLPAGQPVDKASGVTDRELRLQLCHAAIRGNRHFKVSTLEIDREGPSFMSDTLRALHAQYEPGTQFFLIIGEDRASTIKDWHEPQVVIDLCTILAGPRFSGAVSLEWLQSVLPAGARCGTVKIDNSSTFIRAEIARGGSVKYIVADNVARQIAAMELYGAKKPRKTSKRKARSGRRSQD